MLGSTVISAIVGITSTTRVEGVFAKNFRSTPTTSAQSLRASIAARGPAETAKAAILALSQPNSLMTTAPAAIAETKHWAVSSPSSIETNSAAQVLIPKPKILSCPGSVAETQPFNQVTPVAWGVSKLACSAPTYVPVAIALTIPEKESTFPSIQAILVCTVTVPDASTVS